jgi:hypothetical protein
MADSPNREAVRDAFAAVLKDGLGDLVAAVYGYSTVDFENQSPVVIVFSDGTSRTGRQCFGVDSKFTTFVRLRIQAYVADPTQEDRAYTQQMANDLIDLIDKRIADIVTENNDNPGVWRSLNYEEGFSRPRDGLVSGAPYTIEQWTIVAGLPY